MLGLTSKAYCAPRGPVRSLLMFLFHLAWKSRMRLPVLIAVGFMVLDLRMQLEINIDLGNGGMQGIPVGGQENEQNDEEVLIDVSDIEEDSDSISTLFSCSINSSSSSENSEDDDDNQIHQPINLNNVDWSRIGLSADDSTRIQNQEDG